jgi:hypothetical protein
MTRKKEVLGLAPVVFSYDSWRCGMPIENESASERTARLGTEIYQRIVARNLKAEDHGKVVAIDVDTELWAIGENAILAADALQRVSAAADVWIVRVGSDFYHRIRRQARVRQAFDCSINLQRRLSPQISALPVQSGERG